MDEVYFYGTFNNRMKHELAISRKINESDKKFTNAFDYSLTCKLIKIAFVKITLNNKTPVLSLLANANQTLVTTKANKTKI